jgi:iron complex outermembrane receptor protein
MGASIKFAAAAWFAALILSLGAAPAQAQSAADLQQMSIGDLADVDVTSVTKTSESLAEAPGAIFVISHEDILRSGASSIPEILRLAPNLQVFQTSAGKYVITARGFSGNANAQSFSNKLLVLIDGRSVYTPLYSGVYWDTQDVLPEDVDRIEVISGPGATLWGANAVNGVINIITRKSSQTQGGFLQVTGGAQERTLSVRYGGHVGDDVSWRLYGRSLYRNDTVDAAGVGVRDRLSKPQGGFRLDWTPGGENAFTLQGDAYGGYDAQPGAADEKVRGGNLLARWTRTGQDGSSLQAQGYFDKSHRGTAGVGDFTLDTWDLDVQFASPPGGRQQWVVGASVRSNRYSIRGLGALTFSPAGRTLNQGSVFAQDSIALTPSLKLILGIKFEGDAYSGVETLPSVRLAWKPTDHVLLWASAQRAVRSPTPFDRDVVETVGVTPFLIGGPNFQPETLIAYELGARVQLSRRASFSASTYYNDYDDLRTIEPKPGGFIPLRWGNGMTGHTYGLEAWGDFQAASWWRLSAGLNLLHKDLSFKPGASGILGVAMAGDDPPHQVFLSSSMNLGRDVTLDAAFRNVAALPAPHVAGYSELNVHLAWNLNDDLQLSLSGANLLHERHQEFPAPQANAVPRSVSVGLQWRF